jgi:CRISPR/Cas system CSM-associated protein Csm2 small subunit
MLRNEFYAKLGLTGADAIENIVSELHFLQALINMRSDRIAELENYVRILEKRLERFTDDTSDVSLGWDAEVDV